MNGLIILKNIEQILMQIKLWDKKFWYLRALRATKLIALTNELLQEHYAHIADRPFFPEIVEFMSSRPVLALVLEGENAVAAIRELLGPTDSTQAPAGTIRGDMGTTSMKNICHASDSVENAAIEVDRFFEPSEVH